MCLAFVTAILELWLGPSRLRPFKLFFLFWLNGEWPIRTELTIRHFCLQFAQTIDKPVFRVNAKQPRPWPRRTLRAVFNWVSQNQNQGHHSSQSQKNTDDRVNQSKVEVITCQLTQSAGKRLRVSNDWFWFYSSLDETKSRELLNQSGGAVSAQPYSDTRVKATLMFDP